MHAQIIHLMNTEKTYSISFTGLKDGNHTFEYVIDNKFFENFSYDDFNSINTKITVLLNKKTNLLEVKLTAEGVVNVPCDSTNENFDLPIENEFNLIVKFGEEFNNDHDELLVIPFTAHEIDLTHYIYELLVLSIPVKRVHPDVVEDEDEFDEDEFDSLFDDDNDDFDNIEDFDDEDIDEDSNNKEIDPRWDELKKLLTDK